MHRFGAWLVIATSACHVTTRTETTRPGATERVSLPDGAIARPTTLVLSEAGTLRFVEPLECPTEEIVTSVTTIEVATGPNLATFVVGVIATAVGGVMTVRGVTGDGTRDPVMYAGAAGLAIGLPLAIGPWLGHRVELQAGGETAPVRRAGPGVPCGARPVGARAATLTIRDIEVRGGIDADGVFAISPFQLIDAYAPATIPAWDVSAVVETDGGERTITTVLEAGALASRAAAFLAGADFVTRIEPMRMVPGVSAGTLRVSLTSTTGGPAIRVVLPVKNDGPGDAWALRGQLTSSTKAVDGRMIYIGHLARGAATSRELLIPLTHDAADAIRGSELELSIELRDAHGTAPVTPIRFRGAVLGDAPR